MTPRSLALTFLVGAFVGLMAASVHARPAKKKRAKSLEQFAAATKTAAPNRSEPLLKVFHAVFERADRAHQRSIERYAAGGSSSDGNTASVGLAMATSIRDFYVNVTIAGDRVRFSRTHRGYRVVGDMSANEWSRVLEALDFAKLSFAANDHRRAIQGVKQTLATASRQGSYIVSRGKRAMWRLSDGEWKSVGKWRKPRKWKGKNGDLGSLLISWAPTSNPVEPEFLRWLAEQKIK